MKGIIRKIKDFIKNPIVRKTMPVIIVLCALLIAYIFLKTSPTAPRAEPRMVTPQIQAYYAERGDKPIFIDEIGTLVASQSITLRSKVSGTISRLAPEFEAGNKVKRNTTLLNLDSAEYKASLDKAQATLARTKADYELELGQQSVAASDFVQLQEVMPEMQNLGKAETNLALRKPQLEQAKASVAIAEADYSLARTAMNDTVIKAPFDALIASRLVSTGQRIGTSESLAELVATDKYHIEVGIAVDTLYTNGILSTDIDDIIVEITTRGGEVWEGKLLQVIGVLATGSRLGKMLISVDDPLALDKNKGKVPLLLGDQVNIHLEAGVFDDVFALPRSAVRNNNVVWLVENNMLRSVTVDIAWRDTNNIYVKSDEIPDRAVFLTSDLLNPIENMQMAVTITNENDVPRHLRQELVRDTEAEAAQRQANMEKRRAEMEAAGIDPNQAGQRQRPAGAGPSGSGPSGAGGQRPSSAE